MKRVDPSIAAMLLVLSTALGRASAQDQAAVGGVVRDLRGVPQLGALVELLGPGSSVLAHTYTDDHGRYVLSAPEAGRYQLRTSAAFLLPVLRRNLHVGSGGRTMADITMSALFDMGNWFPAEARSKTEPTDDWRWTLRSSAERPLLRMANSTQNVTDTSAVSSSASNPESLIPDDGTEVLSASETSSSVKEHQQFSVSAGSQGTTQDGTRQSWRAERETATGSVSSLQMVVGTPSRVSDIPAITGSTEYQQQNSFTHTEYRIATGFAWLPEVTGAGQAGYTSVTLASGERILLGDLVSIDAGTLLSAERLVSSRVSTAPFLRLTVHPASHLILLYRYAASREVQNLDDLGGDASNTSPLTDAAGRPVGTSDSHQELAISRASERDVAKLAVYRDGIATGAIEGVGNSEVESYAAVPVFGNRESGEFAVAVKGYTGRGLSASWTHEFSADLQATLQADFGTALAVQESKVVELRTLQGNTRSCDQPALTATLAGKLPGTATTFQVRYHWQPKDTLTSVNPFDTATDEAYAGFLLRQRLWHGRRLQSVSAILEASNLLEEGYQPVVGPDGQTLFLAQVPRTVQARLTFSF